MRKQLLLSLIFVGLASASFGQKLAFNLRSPSAFGIEFTQGNEKNFLFDDLDYFYRTNTLKLQFYYPCMQWRKLELSLVIQPQIQLVQHQLYNEQFVRPNETDYQLKRATYTKLKNLSLAAIEFTIDVKRPIFSNTAIFIQVGVGLALIDTETERLARGFTFIENLNAGFECAITNKTSFRLFSGVGHVSNFNFKQPNSGYNALNTGISLRYSLH